MKEHEAVTGSAGKATKLLPGWVPDAGTAVKVVQRTTGDERLLTFTFQGGLPSQCVPLGHTGSPTDAELADAYASDSKTADTHIEDWTRTPTLDADWWPAGQEKHTMALCGRWWVSQSKGTVFAFAPDTVT